MVHLLELNRISKIRTSGYFRDSQNENLWTNLGSLVKRPVTLDPALSKLAKDPTFGTLIRIFGSTSNINMGLGLREIAIATSGPWRELTLFTDSGWRELTPVTMAWVHVTYGHAFFSVPPDVHRDLPDCVTSCTWNYASMRKLLRLDASFAHFSSSLKLVNSDGNSKTVSSSNQIESFFPYVDGRNLFRLVWLRAALLVCYQTLYGEERSQNNLELFIRFGQPFITFCPPPQHNILSSSFRP